MSRYYPLSALVAASGMSEAALARAVGLSGTTLKNARERGLREDAADRYATRAGFASQEVWHDFGLVACAECARLFAQSRAGHRYCSNRCYQNEYQRGWRARREAEDPAFKASRRTGTTAWREKSRRTKRIKDLAYYQANAERIRARARERYHAKRAQGEVNSHERTPERD